jgi:hypothetical protein
MKGTEHSHLDSVIRPNYDTVLWSKKLDKNEVMLAFCNSRKYLAACHGPQKHAILMSCFIFLYIK